MLILVIDSQPVKLVRARSIPVGHLYMTEDRNIHIRGHGCILHVTEDCKLTIGNSTNQNDKHSRFSWRMQNGLPMAWDDNVLTDFGKIEDIVVPGHRVELIHNHHDNADVLFSKTHDINRDYTQGVLFQYGSGPFLGESAIYGYDNIFHLTGPNAFCWAMRLKDNANPDKSVKTYGSRWSHCKPNDMSPSYMNKVHACFGRVDRDIKFQTVSK